MQSILTIALGTTFPKENINSILEVIAATPNPNIAAEILLGIYQEPVVQPSAVIDKKNCLLERYDKWTDRVYYSYMVNDRAHIYIKQGTDTSLITEENYKEFGVTYSSKDTIGHNVILSKMISVKNDIHLESWNGKPLCTENLVV
jgi:hypothetical protein